MCTYATQQCAVSGSGKAAVGWFAMTTATVYVDHPVHAQAGHTLNIDFAAPERGPAARVAVELHPESAMRLLSTIAAALLSAPSDILQLRAAERERLAQLVGGPDAAHLDVDLGAHDDGAGAGQLEELHRVGRQP